MWSETIASRVLEIACVQLSDVFLFFSLVNLYSSSTMMKILGLQADEPDALHGPPLVLSPPESPIARGSSKSAQARASGAKASTTSLAASLALRASGTARGAGGGVLDSFAATSPTRGSRSATQFASPTKFRASLSQPEYELQAAVAKHAYSRTFTGLQSYGPSGMSVLDELTDMALTACEKGRTAGQKHHARGAALLSQSGKIYTGCDVRVKSDGGNNGVSAERACVLAAVADGESVFHCLVIASDTMKSFPVPDGQSREFLRSFGAYCIVLVNCVMENKQTSTQDLFPLNDVPEQPPALRDVVTSNVDDDMDDLADLDIVSWDVERTKAWLADVGLADMHATFQANKVDGRLLLQIDEKFASDILDIHQAVRRRKLVRHVQRLKTAHLKDLQRKTVDELDEYVLLLESHRIKLVAKLKAIFDRFDADKEGRLSGVHVEQALVYMNRPVDSAAVNAWLLRLKDKGLKIEFPDFVAQYTALFAGEDPDVPLGEATRELDSNGHKSSSAGARASSVERGSRADERGGGSPSRRASSREENWLDDDGDRERYRSRRDLDDDELRERRPRDDDVDGERETAQTKAVLEKDIQDIKVLAELKGTFDRFAVDGLMTPPETCQALTECGLVAPRREIAQYLKNRKHLGISRTITFFEFMRAFVAIRGPTSKKPKVTNGRTLEIDGSALREGSKVEARYNGRGRWYTGTVKRINTDGTVDVAYDDGEKDVGLSKESIRVLEHDNVKVRDRNRDRDQDQDRDRDLDRDRDRNRDRERASERSSASYRRVRDREDERSSVDRRTERDRDRPASRYDEGDRVEGNYRGRGKWYAGKISRDRGDGTFDINYDDGEKETRVDKDLIRRKRTDEDSDRDRNRDRDRDRDRSRDSPRNNFRDGDFVECRLAGRWRAGKVVYAGSSFVDVKLSTGDVEKDVSLDLVRPADEKSSDRDSPREKKGDRINLRESDKVEARYRGRSKYYPGKISRDRGDGTFDVDYDDGEKETRVDKDLIRLIGGGDRAASPSKARLEEGAKVEGNYRGRGKWYAGKISRDRLDGTFDVDYDDGEKETRVDKDFVRLR